MAKSSDILASFWSRMNFTTVFWTSFWEELGTSFPMH